MRARCNTALALSRPQRSRSLHFFTLLQSILIMCQGALEPERPSVDRQPVLPDRETDGSAKGPQSKGARYQVTNPWGVKRGHDPPNPPGTASRLAATAECGRRGETASRLQNNANGERFQRVTPWPSSRCIPGAPEEERNPPSPPHTQNRVSMDH
ncbi:hypothetical protein NDU88_004168 [Pleurodeles waltl]|uniref:Uncharacterized protein n=1 Tax=Pleurodeles waltl TaxID=8319 RepID=A0AAV7REZ4_PLEWA|nr:hypothetical protein NDU88_004168 [Pleurodeles waltl]